jgi:hypothetical protein
LLALTKPGRASAATWLGPASVAERSTQGTGVYVSQVLDRLMGSGHLVGPTDSSHATVILKRRCDDLYEHDLVPIDQSTFGPGPGDANRWQASVIQAERARHQTARSPGTNTKASRRR